MREVTPALVSQINSINAHLSWAKDQDRRARTEPARKAALDRFEGLVDPNNEMDPETRAKAAKNLKTAFYKQMALKSAAVRRERTRARKAAAARNADA